METRLSMPLHFFWECRGIEVQSSTRNKAPTTWVDLRNMLLAEFVPANHVRRTRDKLSRLKHTFSVCNYLAEFRNVILTITDVTDGEKLHLFCSGLKYEIRVDYLKSSVLSFEGGASIELRINSDLLNAWNMDNTIKSGHTIKGEIVPTEIGNMEHGTPTRTEQ